jgi:hypothetical protein
VKATLEGKFNDDYEPMRCAVTYDDSMLAGNGGGIGGGGGGVGMDDNLRMPMPMPSTSNKKKKKIQALNY